MEAIKQLRDRLKSSAAQIDVDYSDLIENEGYLVHWLNATDRNVFKAEQMLLESLKWRKENNFESLLDKIVEGNYYNKFPYYLDGQDREGRTIFSFASGTWDIPSHMAAGERGSLYEYFIQMFAKLEAKVICQAKACNSLNWEKNEKIIPHQSVWVVDVKGISLKQLMCRQTIGLVLDLTRYIENYFPGIVHRAYFVNATGIFPFIFKLMKRFISARTLSSIEILGTDESKWTAIVFDNIDRDQLRPLFGGTMG